MTTGLAPAVANAALDAFLHSGTPFVKLHVGDPGAAGTANPATNTTRVAPTMASAAGGSSANTAELDWTGVSTSEHYTFFSIWDASTAGNFKVSGTLTGNAVTAGDNYAIPIGDLVVALGVAA